MPKEPYHYISLKPLNVLGPTLRPTPSGGPKYYILILKSVEVYHFSSDLY